MNKLSIYEQLCFSTTRIETEDEKGCIFSGTGFFFNLKVKDGVVPLLVTNKHVVKGMKKGVFRFTTADENGNPKCTEHFISKCGFFIRKTMSIFVCCQYYL